MDNGNVDSGNEFVRTPAPSSSSHSYPSPSHSPSQCASVASEKEGEGEGVWRGGEQQGRPEELSAAVGPAAERDRGRDRPTERVAQRRNRSVSPITLRPLLILLQLLSVPSSHEG